VANRLEHACLDGDGPRIAPELDGLPYVLVRLTGEVETETSSLIEAHRINSPYIISDATFQQAFKERSAYKKGLPLDWKKIGQALFFLDPNSLLHGVFMANLEDGRIKVPRMLSGFIEAEDIREVASGGVKNNPLDPTGKIRAAGYDKDVYGNVPYHRTEYTARRIVAYFNFDLSLLAGYGLDSEAGELLAALGLYKVRRFLNGGLRLRTACDFAAKEEVRIQAPAGFSLPSESELLTAVRRGIQLCTGKGLFAHPAVTQLSTRVVLKGGDKEKGTEGTQDSESVEEDA
jgi:CRISPR-associated protein Csb1